MKGFAAKIIKKVSLEVIYEAIEERTAEIKRDIAELRNKQEADFRYLNQRIDQINQRIDQKADALEQKIDKVDQKVDALEQKINTQIGLVNQKIDTQIGQVNQRLDTIMQILVELSKQKN